jgi:hypothetical protein
MAISNLKNEPRREIIEQAVGIAAIVAFLFLDYAFVRWLGAVDKADVIFGMILVAGLAPPAVLTLVFGVHAVGELVCGGLAAMGYDPRPTQRTRR